MARGCAAAAAAEHGVLAAPGSPAEIPRPAAVRRKKGKIDYDANIAQKKEQMKVLSRELSKTKADSRNEQRKKQRLVRKASQLTLADLYRIAALKSAGMWDPSLGLPEVPVAGADAAAAARDAEAAPPPPLADAGGAGRDHVPSSAGNPVAAGASPATPVAPPVGVDATDDGSDLEEDVP